MLHPFDMICSILRRRLGAGALDPAVIAALDQGEIDDCGLVAVASSHRITPALAACFSDLGLDGRLPPELRDYLAFMRASNEARNRRLREELGAIVLRLNGVGVEPCLLKGAARLVDGLYPDDSWRFMIDLDLLVPEERLADCVDALRSDGYESGRSDDAESQHYPALFHARRCASVELHRRLTPASYLSLLPIDELLAEAAPLNWNAGRVHVLRYEDQIVYLLAHSQLFHNRGFFGRMSLCDAVELNLLIRRCGLDLDWTYVLNRLERRDWRRACLSLLHGAEVLLGTRTPEHSTPDLLTRLQVTRMLGQQRSRSAMAVGIVLGWIVYGFHRLRHHPDRRRFLARLAADPKSYLGELHGILADFAPRPQVVRRANRRKARVTGTGADD